MSAGFIKIFFAGDLPNFLFLFDSIAKSFAQFQSCRSTFAKRTTSRLDEAKAQSALISLRRSCVIGLERYAVQYPFLSFR